MNRIQGGKRISWVLAGTNQTTTNKAFHARHLLQRSEKPDVKEKTDPRVLEKIEIIGVEADKSSSEKMKKR